MKTRVVAVVAGVLALVCVGTALSAGSWLEAVLGHYPGALHTGGEGLTLRVMPETTLTRQALYQTGDELAAVKRWYAQRLSLAPASTLDAAGGGCVQLAQSRLLWRLEHKFAVLLCAEPYGTQVAVNETLALLLR